MPTSNGWKKDKLCLLKTIQLWSKTLGYTIYPSIYKEIKYMKYITALNMTIWLGKTLEDTPNVYRLLSCVFRNRAEGTTNTAKDNTVNASLMAQIDKDMWCLAKVDPVALPMDLPSFALIISTFTAEV